MSKRRANFFQSGEIATIIAIGSMIFILVTTVASSLISRGPQITQTRAALNCPQGPSSGCKGAATGSCYSICSSCGNYTYAMSYEVIGNDRYCCCKPNTGPTTPPNQPTQPSGCSTCKAGCEGANMGSGYYCCGSYKGKTSSGNCPGGYHNSVDAGCSPCNVSPTTPPAPTTNPNCDPNQCSKYCLNYSGGGSGQYGYDHSTSCFYKDTQCKDLIECNPSANSTSVASHCGCTGITGPTSTPSPSSGPCPPGGKKSFNFSGFNKCICTNCKVFNEGTGSQYCGADSAKTYDSVADCCNPSNPEYDQIKMYSACGNANAKATPTPAVGASCAQDISCSLYCTNNYATGGGSGVYSYDTNSKCLYSDGKCQNLYSCDASAQTTWLPSHCGCNGVSATCAQSLSCPSFCQNNYGTGGGSGLYSTDTSTNCVYSDEKCQTLLTCNNTEVVDKIASTCGCNGASGCNTVTENCASDPSKSITFYFRTGTVNNYFKDRPTCDNPGSTGMSREAVVNELCNGVAPTPINTPTGVPGTNGTCLAEGQNIWYNGGGTINHCNYTEPTDWLPCGLGVVAYDWHGCKVYRICGDRTGGQSYCQWDCYHDGTKYDCWGGDDPTTGYDVVRVLNSSGVQKVIKSLTLTKDIGGGIKNLGGRTLQPNETWVVDLNAEGFGCAAVSLNGVTAHVIMDSGPTLDGHDGCGGGVKILIEIK